MEKSDHDIIILTELEVRGLKKDLDEIIQWQSKFEKEVKEGYVLRVEFAPVVKVLWMVASAVILFLAYAILQNSLTNKQAATQTTK